MSAQRCLHIVYLLSVYMYTHTYDAFLHFSHDLMSGVLGELLASYRVGAPAGVSFPATPHHSSLMKFVMDSTTDSI